MERGASVSGGAGKAFWKKAFEESRTVIIEGTTKAKFGIRAGQQRPWVSFSSSYPSSEVTHVVMEQTSAEEAICWQKNMDALLPGRPQPVLLDISWFTESMAAGQPVPEEVRHHLEVS